MNAQIHGHNFFLMFLQSGIGDEAQQKEAADKEELKNALISAQESAAIQLLLEACLQATNVCARIWLSKTSVLSEI